MASRPLNTDTALGVRLSAICSRNRYTDDPDPVLEELYATADDRTDLLAEEAGTWSGFYDSEHTHVLAMALLTIPGTEQWVELGRKRRDAVGHSTPGT